MIVDKGKSLNIAKVKPEAESKNAMQSVRLQETQTSDSWICICAWCKKVWIEPGLWVELVVPEGECKITHGICPECEREVRLEISRL